MSHTAHTSLHKASGAGDSPLPRLILLAGDYAAILAAEFAALFVRNFLLTYSVYGLAPRYFYIVIPAVFMAFLAAGGLYTKKMPFYQGVEKIFRASLYGTAFCIILVFLGHVSQSVSRFYTALFGIFVFLALTLVRYAVKRTLGKTSLMATPVLIVGAGLTADAVISEFRKDTGLNYEILGFLEDNAPRTKYAGDYPILGGFSDMERVVAEMNVRHILIAAPGLPQDELAGLLYRAQTLCPDVGVIPNLIAVPMSNVEAESYYDAKIMVLRVKNNLASRANRLLKRAFDLTLTIVGGLAISIPLAYIAYRIRKDSDGEIVYSGERVGQDGKLFKCRKFRSMYVNSDEILEKYLEEHPEKREEWEVYHKLKDHDPRVTPFGEILRRTSLDELPQIFNVLKGEMSLVGPRPYLTKELPDMGEASRVILMAKPGITGYWQTSGRNDVTFAERLHMESWYVCNWSIWMDIVLLWRTIRVVFKREGAY